VVKFGGAYAFSAFPNNTVADLPQLSMTKSEVIGTDTVFFSDLPLLGVEIGRDRSAQ
jgi:hypothetical protein